MRLHPRLPRAATIGLTLLAACGGGDRKLTASDSAQLSPPAPSASAEAPEPPAILEGYPDDVIVALNDRTARIIAAAAGAAAQRDSDLVAGVQSVVTVSKQWTPGEQITVAFLGGSPQLRQQIASAVGDWSQSANLTFDFWTDASRQQFREWARSDGAYRAHIRIAFDQPGYWSHVGRDAIDLAVARPNAPSMNLQGFDVRLPSDWRATTLHEFGHAIGFQHEHQSSGAPCEEEFRWESDPGYVPTPDTFGQLIADGAGRRPGIYAVLGGPPNGWSRAKVDYNLRRFAFTTDNDESPFDPGSIMKYYFDAWMFRAGSGSRCYSPRNVALSAQDRTAAAAHYPRDVGAAAAREQALAVEVRAKTRTLPAPAAVQRSVEQAVTASRKREAGTSTAIP